MDNNDKRPYKRPTMKVFGDMSKITHGSHWGEWGDTITFFGFTVPVPLGPKDYS